jgi:hypothetical protein
MFPYQALKKHAPFISGGTYTVTDGQNNTVAVIRSTLGPANGSRGDEQWAFAAGTASGVTATLRFSAQEYGPASIDIHAFPDHLPWPGTQGGASSGPLNIQNRKLPPSADLAPNLRNGQTDPATVHYVSSAATVQNPAPAAAGGLTTQPGANVTGRRVEVLKSATGKIVGHVYAEWSSATSSVQIWQLVKNTSFTPTGIASFAPGGPQALPSPGSLSAWYSAAVADLGTGLIAISGTATRFLTLPQP